MHTYTEEEIVELKACIKSPLYFITNYIKLETLDGREIPIDLSDIQKELLEFYETHQHSLSSIHRQAGQSTLACAYLLWYVLFHSDKTVLIGSSNLRNARQFIEIIRGFYNRIPKWLSVDQDPCEWNKTNLSFMNNSKILSQSISPNTARGFAVSIMYIDDLSTVSPKIQEQFLQSVLPILYLGGKTIINTLPSREDDTTNKIYHDGISGEGKFAVIVKPIELDDPRVPLLREMLGEEIFDREYLCKWVKYG